MIYAIRVLHNPWIRLALVALLPVAALAMSCDDGKDTRPFGW